jgi:hypothetical protein
MLLHTSHRSRVRYVGLRLLSVSVTSRRWFDFRAISRHECQLWVWRPHSAWGLDDDCMRGHLCAAAHPGARALYLSMPAPWWSPRAELPTASWLGQRVNLRMVKARAAVRARVGAYAILDSVGPAPRAHAYGARWSTWTARRANALRLTGRNKYHLLGPSQMVLFSNNNKISNRLFWLRLCTLAKASMINHTACTTVSLWVSASSTSASSFFGNASDAETGGVLRASLSVRHVKQQRVRRHDSVDASAKATKEEVSPAPGLESGWRGRGTSSKNNDLNFACATLRQLFKRTICVEPWPFQAAPSLHQPRYDTGGLGEAGECLWQREPTHLRRALNTSKTG